MRKSAKFFFLAFLLLLWTTDYGLLTKCGTMGYAYAEIPHLINYQGRLTNKEGKPVADGAYQLTFRIYDAATAGNLLWEETHSSVLIQKGIFSILLGSVTNLNLAFDKPYFLEIKTGDEVMTPRQQITSAGYAIRAEKTEVAERIKINNSDVNAGYLSEKIDGITLGVNNSAKLEVKDASLTLVKFANFTIGDSIEVSAPTESKGLINTSYTKVKEITLARNGNVRIKFEMAAGYPDDAIYVQIYKNGVPIGVEKKTTSLSYVEYSEDIYNVKVGDAIQLYYRIDEGTVTGRVSGKLRNFSICVGNPMMSAVKLD